MLKEFVQIKYKFNDFFSKVELVFLALKKNRRVFLFLSKDIAFSRNLLPV